jgi:hypothetical protein
MGLASSMAMLIWGGLNYKTYYTACSDSDGNIVYRIYRDCGYMIATDVIFIALGTALAFLLVGWGINFILSGHKSPLPWVANKETNND